MQKNIEKYRYFVDKINFKKFFTSFFYVEQIQ